MQQSRMCWEQDRNGSTCGNKPRCCVLYKTNKTITNKIQGAWYNNYRVEKYCETLPNDENFIRRQGLLIIN